MSKKNLDGSARDQPVKREDKQDRKFCVELYPDATDYNCSEVLKVLETVHEFAYITHDKDVDDDGVVKKAHIHAVLRYVNPRKLSTVANQLGIDTRYIQTCIKFKSAERYLVHRTPDSFDKYQYNPREVITNMPNYLYDVGEANECTALSLIYELLDSGKYTLSQLGRYLATKYADPAVYSAFRRNFSILKAYYDEEKCHYNYMAFREQKYTPTVTVDMNLVNELMRCKNEN